MSEFIPLTEVPKLLPKRRRGARLALPTLWRWCTHGVRGHVLQSWKIGCQRCTTQAALEAFFTALAGHATPIAKTPSGATRQRREKVRRELAEAGI